jgi:predicted RNase H-like HicB family nuclease
VSQGKAREAAIKNIKEAIHVYIGALEEDRLPVPPETFDAELLNV